MNVRRIIQEIENNRRKKYTNKSYTFDRKNAKFLGTSLTKNNFNIVEITNFDGSITKKIKNKNIFRESL